MIEEFEYRSKRMQLLYEQIKWLIQHQQFGVCLDELASRAQLGKWEVRHLFQEFLGKDPISFIRDAFSPSLAQVGSTDQFSFFDSLNAVKSQTSIIPVHIQQIEFSDNHIIYYTKIQSFLGEIFLAATDQGICQLTFEDSENGLERLQKMFPKSSLIEERIEIHGIVFDALTDYFSRDKKKLQSIPIAVNGNQFHLRLWEELIRLKPGELTTHELLAETMGEKISSRTIASAINLNPVAWLIPDYRAIPENRKIGKAQINLWRKQALLAIEK